MTKQKTEDLIKLIRAELSQKVVVDPDDNKRVKPGRYTKAELLVRTLVNSCIAKVESGQFATDGVGDFNMTAMKFVVESLHGRPSEKRDVRVDVFQHYPDSERLANVEKYKTIEIKPESVQ
jgi:hypothetical protein